MWMAPAAPMVAIVPRISLTVRVYQTTDLPSTLSERALREAARLLRAGLVDVRWVGCTGVDPSPICSVPPGPSELILALRDGAACQRLATLGEALVVHDEGGVLATVYANCVASLASAGRSDVAVLLGRVTAHELGHLMIGTSAHARHGLMRRNWTANELLHNRAADWAFTTEDIAAMHSRQAQ